MTDVDTSVAFYQDVLGIPLLFQVPGMPMALFASGDVRLYLGVPESPEFRSKVVLYFTVTDIDAESGDSGPDGLSFTGQPHVVHRDASGELWKTSPATRMTTGSASCSSAERLPRRCEPLSSAHSAGKHQRGDRDDDHRPAT